MTFFDVIEAEGFVIDLAERDQASEAHLLGF